MINTDKDRFDKIHDTKEYHKQNMLQVRTTWAWLCIKCHNLAIKEAA